MDKLLTAVDEIAILRCLRRYLAFPLLLGFVSYQALVPGDQAWTATGWDKANHLLAFAALCAAWDGACPRWCLWPTKCLWLIGYGLALELVQGALWRDSSVLDLLVDVLGVACYLLLRWTVLCGRTYWSRAGRR